MSVSLGWTEFGRIQLPIDDLSFVIGRIISGGGRRCDRYVSSPFHGWWQQICLVG